MTVTDPVADLAKTSTDISAEISGDESLSRWPGYGSFTAADKKRLPGRDDEVAKLVRAFGRPKSGQAALVWLCGASGCGKTSLIEAGVCPALRDGFGEGFHAIRVVPKDGDDPMALIEAIAEGILSESPDEDDLALDLQHRLRQFSLLHGQDCAEAAEYLASCYKRSRPLGVRAEDKVVCLVVIDEFDQFAPEGANFLPEEDSWQEAQLCPVLRFLHELILTGVFPCLVSMRSANVDSVKFGLSLCDSASLGTWFGLEPLELEVVRPFFRSAPAQLQDSDHVNVEPMLLDALIEDAGDSAMGIPFISETLRKLSEIDPNAEDLSTADVGWAGGISEKYAAAAESAVPDGLDDDTLGELMLSLQRQVRSGVNEGETVSSTAKYADLIGRSDMSRRLVDNLVNVRVLHLSGVGGDAEVQWSVPGALHDWERALRWLKEEDRRLITAQRFERKREEWEKEERTPVLLEHANFALGDARTLLAHHQKRPFLSEEVIEFLDESLELDQRLSGEIRSDKTKGQLLMCGGIALIVIAVFVLVWLIFLR